MSWGNDDTTFMVLVNHEEQYSLWPKSKAIPDGWRSTRKEGLKPECLKYVAEVWTDMRPLSLRRSLDEFARRQSNVTPDAGLPSEADAMDLALGSVSSDVIH